MGTQLLILSTAIENVNLEQCSLKQIDYLEQLFNGCLQQITDELVRRDKLATK